MASFNEELKTALEKAGLENIPVSKTPTVSEVTLDKDDGSFGNLLSLGFAGLCSIFAVWNWLRSSFI